MENYLVMQDHEICEDEEKQEEVEEELVEKKVNFVDALQGLEAGRKYIQQSDVHDDKLVTGRMLEHKLYALKHQEKREQITKLDRIRK